MRHAEFARHRLTSRVEVDADDFVGTHHLRALNDVEPNAAQAEYDDVCARLNFGCEQHRTYARSHPATDVADFVEGRIFANFR